MKYRLLLIPLILFLLSCDKTYTRTFDGIISHLNQQEFLTVFRGIAGEIGFDYQGDRSGDKQGLIISEYTKRDYSINREVGIAVYLNGSELNEGRIEVQIVIGTGGLEDETKEVINAIFDSVVLEIKREFSGKIQIVKISEPW